MESEVRNRRENNIDIVKEYENQYIAESNASEFFDKVHWNERTEEKRKEILESVEKDIKVMFDNLKETIIAEYSDLSNETYQSPKKQSNINGKGDSLPEKSFQNRESVLTNLLKISHIRTVYHMFVAILIIFSLNTMLTDWVEKGGIIHIYHFEWILWAFGGFGNVILIWLGMKSFTIFVYPCFLSWLYVRRLKILSNRCINRLYLFSYIVLQIMSLITPLYFMCSNDLPPCSSAIVVLENIRLIMKIHAFIRENVAKEFRSKDLLETINFSRYLYFLFAPTLVYRDSYPKNPTIRWSYVMSNFVQVLFCIVYMYYIFARFCIVYFQNFNSIHVTMQQLVLSIFGCMLPATLVLFICFFCFLHSWLNAFAEMLQFGDRLFYKEWWNSTTFSNYYRTWNVVVHDWLYTYVYRDILLLCYFKNRAAAMTIVFLFSAVVHEYVLIVMFRFFYPVLFVLFSGFGFGMMFIKGRARFWNIGFWVAMFTGNGIIMCLYSMEWYARRNCPIYFNTFIDLLVPRSWFCQL